MDFEQHFSRRLISKHRVLFCTCALPAALYLQCRFYDKDDHAACFPEALSLWAFWGRVLTPFVILNKIFQYATGLRSHSG